METICMKCLILFPGKKQNIINLSSAEFAQIVVNVNIFLSTSEMTHFAFYSNKEDFYKTVYRIYPKYSDRNVFANNVDPDQTPQNAVSDLGLHCLPFIQQF